MAIAIRRPLGPKKRGTSRSVAIESPESGQGARLALLLEARGFEFPGQAPVLLFDCGLFRFRARELALQGEADLVRLHQLIAKVGGAADGQEQRLTASLKLVFVARKLSGQLVTPGEALARRLLRRGPLLADLRRLAGALASLAFKD